MQRLCNSKETEKKFFLNLKTSICDVKGFVVGNGHNYLSSNPKKGYSHFIYNKYPLIMNESSYSLTVTV